MTSSTHRPASPPPLIPAIPAFASIGVGRTKAYELLNAKTLPAVKLGRTLMLRPTDFAAYIDSLPAYKAEAA